MNSKALLLLLLSAAATFDGARAQPPGAGGGGGGGGGGTSAGCTNPTCSSPPCAANLRGDVGCTTVTGTLQYNSGNNAWGQYSQGDSLPSGTHIYGAFEAGFGSTQDMILTGLGCSDPSVAYDTEGGLDIDIAEQKMADACNVTLPRIENTTDYIGLVGWCGGHTSDYHFHKSFQCLYDATDDSGHSQAIGVVADYMLYGKWEADGTLPLLDACGGHFGVTPDSNGEVVYHYHVQDGAPFSVGCHGPDSDGGLVSVQTCRSLYSECNDSEAENITNHGVTVSYDRDCPCWDANGSNTGSITQLAALANEGTYNAIVVASSSLVDTGSASTSTSGSGESTVSPTEDTSSNTGTTSGTDTGTTSGTDTGTTSGTDTGTTSGTGTGATSRPGTGTTSGTTTQDEDTSQSTDASAETATTDDNDDDANDSDDVQGNLRNQVESESSGAARSASFGVVSVVALALAGLSLRHE